MARGPKKGRISLAEAERRLNSGGDISAITANQWNQLREIEARNNAAAAAPAPTPSVTNRPPGRTPGVTPMPRLPMPPRTPTTTDDKPAPTVTGTYQKRVLGGYLVTMERLSDGTEREVYRERSQSAGDAVNLMFQNLGLGQGLIDNINASIKSLYANFLDPSEAQILNEIYTSDAYKQRFKGNEVIRQRLANGQGRPGDRMLTPAQYIEQERQYREILQSADMPGGFYDSPDDFTNLIGNSISVAEFRNRVDTAYAALNGQMTS